MLMPPTSSSTTWGELSLGLSLGVHPSFHRKDRRASMSDGNITRHYRAMSAEDRRTFDRWLKANAAAGLIIASGLVAMALLGSNSAGRDATLADNRAVSGLAQ